MGARLARAAGTLAAALALAATLAAGVAHAAPQQAARPRPDAALGELPETILARWRDTQDAAGYFTRPSGSRVSGGYGNSALAYAMLLEAARGGDDAFFAASMRAYGWLAHRSIHPQGVFFRLFEAAGYNLARARFADRAEFQAIRGAWATRLRRFRYDDGTFGVRPYRYNKNVVEAVEVLELLASGLRSSTSGAILRSRGSARRRALHVLRDQVPRRATDYGATVGVDQGWPQTVALSDVSDPPDNPPAYDALVASMYARAYGLLAPARRSARMRDTARRLLRGVIARTAPDGDIAFAGRSQEEAWALTSAMHAAWRLAPLLGERERGVALAYARRVRRRLLDLHVNNGADFFYITPAQSCCGAIDRPPGQDGYFDLASYTGLSAITLGWAIESRPDDWATAGDTIPTDNFSTYHFPTGRGRFLQHRGDGFYWMLREQGDFADARADMAVAVFKARRKDGSWADVIPPRPYSGGHHRAADPASPCLAIGPRGTSCAYLELHGGRPSRAAPGAWDYQAVWRTRSRSIVYAGGARVTPTATGLQLAWSARGGQVFKLDHFLPGARCSRSGVFSAGVAITVVGQASCRVVAHDYAGGARTDLDRVRSVIAPASAGEVLVDYATTL